MKCFSKYLKLVNNNASKVFRALSNKDKYIVLDVGCRWGFADKFISTQSDVKLFGFDPDKLECDRLSEEYKDFDVTLVPMALADKEEEMTLYLTKEPACSSLYKPDKYLTDNCRALSCAEEISTTKINTTTLDRWADDAGISYVDYIKLDTQGSELDVLKGGESLLHTVRAIEVEVEFNPIYSNQHLFSDIDIYLRKKGFVLWKLSNLVHYQDNKCDMMEIRTDSIHYGNVKSEEFKVHSGQLYWADAHYVHESSVRGQDRAPLDVERDIELFDIIGLTDIANQLQNSLKG